MSLRDEWGSGESGASDESNTSDQRPHWSVLDQCPGYSK
jgi:hypothetical protein